MSRATSTSAPAARGSAPPRAAAGAGAVVAMVAALVVVLVTQYAGAWRVPFINDDYVFLDRVRGASFTSLWGFDRLFFHWYRPWSREFHYWVVSGLFGARETPFHIASLSLWVAVHLLYFLLIDRLAGRRAATIATAGLALLAAWAVPVLWIAAVQDLWMIALSLLALNAVARGRGGAAALATAFALLSKETAATLPAIAFLLLVVAQRRPLRDAARVVLPMGLVTVAWAFVHPLLGGRLWHGPAARAAVEGGTSMAETLSRTVLSLVNLDRWPSPNDGWLRVIVVAAPAAIVMCALVVFAWRRKNGGAGAERAAVHAAGSGADTHRHTVAVDSTSRPEVCAAVFGVAWAVLGWLPLLLPGLGWHAYYAIAGACGAWLVLGIVLSRSRIAALVVVAVLAVLRAAAADTPSLDWGTEWYQRRAAAFQEFMRADLLQKLPQPPARARLFFTGVPSHVGFLTEGAPALRVWYRDTTLSGGFFTDYTRRPDGRSADDRFFRYDSTSGWREIRPGVVDAADALETRDARELAATFARVGEWPRAAIEYESIAAVPDSIEAALDAGVARAMAADTTTARAWFTRALQSPRATTVQRATARAYLTELDKPAR